MDSFTTALLPPTGTHRQPHPSIAPTTTPLKAHHTLRHSSPWLDLSYNRLHDYWHCHWKGIQTQDSLVKGVSLLASLNEGEGSYKLLNDLRQVKGAYQIARVWTSRKLNEPLRGAGINQISWLLGENPLVKLAIRLNLPKDHLAGQVVRIFREENAAKLWLLKQH